MLVVEDEFIIALELQSSLEDAGATVIGPAFTLSKALELAEHEDLTAATLDLRLAQESIGPVADVLAGRHIPFLFYSGQPSADPVRRAWPQSIAISKPALAESIVQAVSEIIRQPH